MDIKSVNNSQNFGMAFYHNAQDCQRYLIKAFNNNSIRMRSALSELETKCEKHKHFDMFHSSADDSINIIGKTDEAGEKLAKMCGSAVISLRKDTKYPNFYENMQNNLGELYKSTEGPRNFLERGLFKVFRSAYLQYAKLRMKCNPYEQLPANIRESVDIINTLEKNM